MEVLFIDTKIETFAGCRVGGLGDFWESEERLLRQQKRAGGLRQKGESGPARKECEVKNSECIVVQIEQCCGVDRAFGLCQCPAVEAGVRLQIEQIVQIVQIVRQSRRHGTPDAHLSGRI